MKFAYKPETVKTKHQIAGFKAEFLRHNKKSNSIKTTRTKPNHSNNRTNFREKTIYIVLNL